MHSFNFWQQGVAPGDWSRGVIARNLDGEDFSGYRRGADPSHLRNTKDLQDTGSFLPRAKDAQPDEIVVETSSVAAGLDADGAVTAISRLVSAYGAESDRDETDADAFVQSAGVDFPDLGFPGVDLHGADLFGIELVDTIADASRRAGLDGSPMHAAIRVRGAASVSAEDSLREIGLHRRETDREDGAVPVVGDAKSAPFDTASGPLIQSADDFLML